MKASPQAAKSATTTAQAPILVAPTPLIGWPLRQIRSASV